MKIKLTDLNKILKKLIEKAEIYGFNEIEIDEDYYWKICIDSMTDFSGPDPKLCTGSFKDDIEALNKILNDNEITTLVDFERFAFLIIAIQNEIHNEILSHLQKNNEEMI